jgi:hypothetical protein
MSELRWEDTECELVELRRQDQVLAAMQRMFNCNRRGLCLLREWLRRYGRVSSRCLCLMMLEEQVIDNDLPVNDED